MNDLEVPETKMLLPDSARIINAMCDASRANTGLAIWKHAPFEKILKTDAAVAKNHLNEAHIKELNRIVSAYLDLAENRAERGIIT